MQQSDADIANAPANSTWYRLDFTITDLSGSGEFEFIVVNLEGENKFIKEGMIANKIIDGNGTYTLYFKTFSNLVSSYQLNINIHGAAGQSFYITYVSVQACDNCQLNNLIGDSYLKLMEAEMLQTGNIRTFIDDGQVDVITKIMEACANHIIQDSNGDVITTTGDDGWGLFGEQNTQESHIDDPTGGTTVDSEARAAIVSMLSVLENFGMTADS